MQFNEGVVAVGMSCNHLIQLGGIQDYFIALHEMEKLRTLGLILMLPIGM
jgi:hypothetical protein